VLSATQLVGFGGSTAGGTAYRYFQMNATASNDGTFVALTEMYVVVGDTEHPTATMSSNTAPSPLVASASSETNGAAWYAFNDVISGGSTWNTGSVGGAGYLRIDLGSSNEVVATAVKFIGNDTAVRSPRDWTFEGSNDASSWDVLNTQTGISWTSKEEKTFTL
jgi:hypothetical protein